MGRKLLFLRRLTTQPPLTIPVEAVKSVESVKSGGGHEVWVWVWGCLNQDVQDVQDVQDEPILPARMGPC
ncbi:MAG: hypothetical protein D6765_00195 [Bacteroidetes bacterium]|nr:MAG: hypothetical protein D6765_00195 [Bacteroidota bacterium]